MILLKLPRALSIWSFYGETPQNCDINSAILLRCRGPDDSRTTKHVTFNAQTDKTILIIQAFLWCTSLQIASAWSIEWNDWRTYMNTTLISKWYHGHLFNFPIIFPFSPADLRLDSFFRSPVSSFSSDHLVHLWNFSFHISFSSLLLQFAYERKRESSLKIFFACPHSYIHLSSSNYISISKWNCIFFSYANNFDLHLVFTNVRNNYGVKVETETYEFLIVTTLYRSAKSERVVKKYTWHAKGFFL